MQDFKHLTRKKRFPGFSFPKSRPVNRKLANNTARKSLNLTLPSGRNRERLKHVLLFLAIVLALTPVSMLIFQKAPKAAAGLATWLKNLKPAQTVSVVEAVASPCINRFDSACTLLSEATGTDRLAAVASTGETLHFSVMGGLQKKVHGFLEENQVPYAVFVAIEPSSGRILAMTSYSSVDPAWTGSSFFNLYPMASLFKMITAAAALEARKIKPETVIEFRGGAYSENPSYWAAAPNGRNNSMDVTSAMGRSINPVYGRIASDIAGKESIMEYVNRFGFNQEIMPEVPASTASEPQSDGELKLMGAGLNRKVKISPLHAAVIMAAIANKGQMMAPTLADRITDKGGKVISDRKSREIRKLVSPETASDLTRMLSTTVTSGTSRRAFRNRSGKPVFGDMGIAAKTGSINGENPKGHYSWFAAYAPARAPRIALVALVINPDKWKVKASQVGERALEEFFRRDG